MIAKLLLLIIATATATAAPTGLQFLFPEHRQYIYLVKATVSSGIGSDATYWTLDGRLSVVVGNNFTRARFQLEDLTASAFSGKNGQSSESGSQLIEPWEVDYHETGSIESIYLGSEPIWAKNMKKALSLNFQMTKKSGTYVINEPCLYELCSTVYTTNRNKIKKYTNQKLTSTGTEYYWSSVPTPNSYIGRGYPESMSLTERVYEVNGVKGLISLDLKGSFQYKLNDNLLSVVSELSLYYETYRPVKELEDLDVNKTSIMYVAGDSSNPSNGIRDFSQVYLKNKTYETLLKIVTKGIDADNIVRNSSLIHNLDFSNLLNTMSQVDYDHLVLLFEDLVLGTSYELETARNIFLEMVPYARTNDCARFVKYLVIEKREKLEDASILALIRKLPFNVAKYNQGLLEELEVLTKLGLDFNPEIRRAGILSFATLVHKARAAWSVKQDYLDYIVVKYFRMYSDYPQYFDRLIWLQGLCNMGFAAQAYTNVIYGDTTKNKYERLWAAFGSRSTMPEESYEVLKTTLPILTNDTEHIELRIAAIHMFLSSSTITESDFLFVHNYIKNSTDDQLKSFWYSSMMSIDGNKAFAGYKVASYYVPFIKKQVTKPDTIYWASNNQIISDNEGAATVQVISVGDETMMPAFAGVKLSTGGLRPYQAAIYVLAHGVTAKLYEKVKFLDVENINMESLIKVMKNLGAWSRNLPEKVHIDLVIKIQEMTVYATHINHTSFDNWNGLEVMASVLDFFRWGSHINQQTIHIPSQMEVHIPSVLGIPIRLQSSSMSFSSIRGNLSATGDQDLIIENDLHIRYQGISLTSLSTDGLLLPSEHIVRVQSSMVAHLPLNFNLSFINQEFSLINVLGKKGGIAMHSRTQVAMQTENSIDVRTVAVDKNKIDETGLFSDCEPERNGFDILEKIFASDSKQLQILNSLQLVYIFLKSMLLFASPPLDSCGFVLPSQTISADNDEVIEVKLKALNTSQVWEKLEWASKLKYFNYGNPKDVYLNLNVTSKLHIRDENISISLVINGLQPQATSSMKNWTLVFQQEDHCLKQIDQDITSLPVKYEGVMWLRLHNANVVSSDFKLLYSGRPKTSSGAMERYLYLDAEGTNVPFIKMLTHLSPTFDAMTKSLGNLDNHFDISAVVKEKKDIVSITVNNDTETKFKSPAFGWYMDSWTGVQTMKKIGLYRECRLQESIVETLSGTVERLPQECPQRVVLADCTKKPRFAIIGHSDGGLRMYSGGYYVDLMKGNRNGRLIADADHGGSKFVIQQNGDVIKISSIDTSIDLYYKYPEIVILMPSPYMPSVCGECADDPVPSLC